MLFFFFIDEWIKHIRVVTGDRFGLIDWPTIRGYRTFVPTFIYEVKKLKQLPYFLHSACTSMLLTDTGLINFLIHYMYSKTNVYDTLSTGGNRIILIYTFIFIIYFFNRLCCTNRELV